MKIRKYIKTFVTIFILIFIVGCKNKEKKNIATIEKNKISFEWDKEALKHNAYVFFVPVKLKGINKEFKMQFDLGLNVNVIYEKPLNTILEKYPIYKTHIKNGKDYSVFKHKLTIGNTPSNVDSLFIYKDYGSSSSIDSLKNIGSIGVNEIKGKILVLDFSKRKLEIVSKIGNENIYNFSKLKVTDRDKLIISLNYDNKNYDFLFDTGNGVPIVTTNKNLYNQVSENSKELNDTIRANSWGEKIELFGSKILHNFQIGNNPLLPNHNELIYYTNAKRATALWKEISEEEGINLQGGIGLQLFMDKKIIIDLKNNRFGIEK